jgi:hypothetical protein
MRIIHAGGFPNDERLQTRAVIYSNLVVAFKVLLEIMTTQNIDFNDPATKVRIPNPMKTGLVSLHYCFRLTPVIEISPADGPISPSP